MAAVEQVGTLLKVVDLWTSDVLIGNSGQEKSIGVRKGQVASKAPRVLGKLFHTWLWRARHSL
jgi:hypothetical protein